MSIDIKHAVQLTKETIIVTAQEILGPKAGPVIDNIRNAPNDPQGLRDAVNHCKQMTQSIVGAEGAEAIDVICSTLLRDLEDTVRAESPSPETADASEKLALKARIVKAKLVAATSGLLGLDAQQLLAKIRSAPDTREGLIKAYQECEAIAHSTLSSNLAAEFISRCGEIVAKMT